MSSQTIFNTFAEDGYSFICGQCPIDKARHGPVRFGPREVKIKKCAEHEKKKGPRDEDFERLAKNAWKVDPHSEKFIRKQHAMAGSHKVGRPKGT